MKKKYLVSALGTEALATAEIEAESVEDAKDQYHALWEDGMVEALDYEIDHYTITDQETGEDTVLKD